MIKDIFTKKENQIMLGLIILSVSLVLIGFYLLIKNDTEISPRVIPNTKDDIVWKNYQNKKFNFKLKYPEHFYIFESNDKNETPVINFYYDNKNFDLPIYFNDSFTENSPNNVSFFPEGILGRGITLYFETIEYANKNNVIFELNEFKNPKGDTWAIMANPVAENKNWSEYGFVLISAGIKNQKNVCMNSGVQKAIELCDPYSGDDVYVDGDFDSDFIEIGLEMLDTVTFQ